MALRIRRYDRYVTEFLAREPDGIVVNLGCGLDDRRRRTDNGRVRWFDLDLPEVIALRRAYLPESDRMRFLASSVLDLGWMDALPDEPGTRFLFIAEGLFMYLPAQGVRALVTALHERFPGAELVAEVAHSRIVRIMRGRMGRGKFRRQFGISGDVAYQFGLQDSHDMEAWAPGMVLLDDWDYFDEDEPRLRWMRPFARWPLFRQAQWTVHYRLGSHRGARWGGSGPRVRWGVRAAGPEWRGQDDDCADPDRCAAPRSSRTRACPGPRPAGPDRRGPPAHRGADRHVAV